MKNQLLNALLSDLTENDIRHKNRAFLVAGARHRWDGRTEPYTFEFYIYSHASNFPSTLGTR